MKTKSKAVSPASELGNQPAVALTLHFSAREWDVLEKKARAEGPNCNARSLVQSVGQILACDDDCAAVFLPARIIDRLSDAGAAADLEGFHEAIAEKVLGDLASDPDMVYDLVTRCFQTDAKALNELKAVLEKWKKEDAKGKGGQAK